jgi:4-hydroxy-tetrahydrodipicolinate synthase
LGTTGESTTLSKLEKKTLIEFAVERIDHRVPLVLGMGGNNTSELVLSIHGTLFKDIDAILSVCPYYNKPSQEGIYQHFKIVAEACPVPVILYTVPSRTSSNITASTTLKLAHDFSNIIGIKEASGNFEQIFQILKHRPEGFLVISGDDAITLPMLSAGADGVISVIANVFPKEWSEMVRLGLNGDFSYARKIHFEFIDIVNALFLDGSPGGIKAALSIKNYCAEILRLPLVPVNKGVHKQIKKLIELID